MHKRTRRHIPASPTVHCCPSSSHLPLLSWSWVWPRPRHLGHSATPSTLPYKSGREQNWTQSRRHEEQRNLPQALPKCGALSRPEISQNDHEASFERAFTLAWTAMSEPPLPHTHSLASSSKTTTRNAITGPPLSSGRRERDSSTTRCASGRQSGGLLLEQAAPGIRAGRSFGGFTKTKSRRFHFLGEETAIHFQTARETASCRRRGGFEIADTHPPQTTEKQQ